MCAKDATFLKQHAPGPFKITLPSPSNFAMLCWQAGVSAQAYPSRSEFIADMAALIANEAWMLAEEGVPYIHLDAPVYTHWADDKLVAKYRDAGVDLPRMLDDAIAADNRILDAAKAGGAITGFRLCRGNSMGRWMAEGGYDRLAERMFSEIRCDRWLLEYDSERAGTFDPLKYAPKDKIVVLGLVTTKTGALEKRDDIARRIEAAAHFVPHDRLALSSQWGFASSGRGNPLSEDEQWAKLKLVAGVTHQIWSRA
jgi:5-methyltetrahydropteroyltriglutamate--homocysteine methyltransferase